MTALGRRGQKELWLTSLPEHEDDREYCEHEERRRDGDERKAAERVLARPHDRWRWHDCSGRSGGRGGHAARRRRNDRRRGRRGRRRGGIDRWGRNVVKRRMRRTRGLRRR